jgi:2-phospho-L-lactate guanylyltransferase
MQGTVRNFDPKTGAGDLLLDDGRAIEFPGAAFAASGLRLLRIGQRVRIDTDEAGQVVRLTIATLPFPT